MLIIPGCLCNTFLLIFNIIESLFKLMLFIGFYIYCKLVLFLSYIELTF